MKEIPLTQGKVALVDDADFEFLNQWKWYAAPYGRLTTIWYAQREIWREGVRTSVRMHQILFPDAGYGVDHRDGNGLNNQRYNLRTCTGRQNGANNRGWANKTTSRFKGVFERRDQPGKFRTQIRVNYKLHNVGTFGTELEAAHAYDAAAKLHFGEFACINFPENSSCTLPPARVESGESQDVAVAVR